MSTRLFASALAILLTITFIIPPVLLVAPQKVYAIPLAPVPVPTPGVPVFDAGNFNLNFVQAYNSAISAGIAETTAPKTAVETTVGAIQQTLNTISAATSAAAEVALQINANILQPLAFALSGRLMKFITKGVIDFVIGKINGTGLPQFVTDLRKSMQTVADGQMLAYISQIGQTGSPFAYSIGSALNTDYLSKSSLKGFWAANMNTLAATSPNVGAYLAGNWRQGGVAAWFALTTQTQNNPYMLYANAQGQLAGLIGAGAGGATGAKLTDIRNGAGVGSWCGSSDGFLGSLTTQNSALGTAYNDMQAANIAYGNAVDDRQSLVNENGAEAADAHIAKLKEAADAATARYNAARSSSSGVNIGDPCTNADGTSGTYKTPGSVIVATLNKALGGQFDQITRLGNVGPQVNSILGNIATVLQTMNFGVQILGGDYNSGGAGGLLGVGTPTPGMGGISRLDNFTNSATGNMGVTYTSTIQGAGTGSAVSGTDMARRISDYLTAWDTIGKAARTASTSVVSLIGSSCAAHAAAAQTAFTNMIVPLFNQMDTASTSAAAAAAMITKVQAELTSVTDATATTTAADIQTLQVMPPTSFDVGYAQNNAEVYGTASSTPPGSLTVSGGSLVDQMTLINQNANILGASSCPP